VRSSSGKLRDRADEYLQTRARLNGVGERVSESSSLSHLANDVLNLRRIADVQAEAVSWLWNNYVPFGKLTVLEGDPAMAKTTIAITIAAAVSRGRALPGSPSLEPADVLLATYEDGIADTIRPRLEAAGADLKRVHCIDGTGKHGDLFTIPEHIPALLASVQRVNARLVVVDPLMAALSGRVDAHKDHHVRRALSPLAKAAEESGAAALVVRHLVKSGGARAIMSGGGSIGIGACARVVLQVGEDPNEPGRRVLAVVKNNLAKHPCSILYRVADRMLGGAGAQPVILWEGESTVSANDLAAARAQALEAQGLTKADDAIALLREWLSGGPLAAKDVARLGRDQNISQGTLDRAAVRLGVVKRRSGHGTNHHSEWTLPPTAITPITQNSTLESDGSDGSAGDPRQRNGQSAMAAYACARCGRFAFPVVGTVCFSCRRSSDNVGSPSSADRVERRA
jgi:hypothetical protein